MIPHSRRTFLLGTLALAGCARAEDKKAAGLGAQAPANVTIEDFSIAGVSLGKKTVPRVVHSDDEWRKLLPGESYVVTRREGTERPYSGKYNDNHADGLYRCICCDTALFDSRAKFESGTGWPSFWQPLPNAVGQESDSTLGMERTEIHCRRCGGHLGHVFDDGPPPTGLRYCMNGVALSFKPDA